MKSKYQSIRKQVTEESCVRRFFFNYSDETGWFIKSCAPYTLLHIQTEICHFVISLPIYTVQDLGQYSKLFRGLNTHSIFY